MNVNDERARFADEVGTTARSLSRLADLASVLDAGSTEVNIDQLNELAGRLHRWSLEVAKDLDRPALSDELQQRQQAFVDWRDLHERVRARSRLRNN